LNDKSGYLLDLARKAKRAAGQLSTAPSEAKNATLEAMASSLVSHSSEIILANSQDVRKAQEMGLSASMVKRLVFGRDKIRAAASSLSALGDLEDPVGKIDRTMVRPNGLHIVRTRVPLGVIGMIYESRPGVTVDAAGICLKSGNAVILKGGAEALETNKAIASALREGISRSGLDENAVSLVEDTSRQCAQELMRLRGYIDLLIPRGGWGLIRSVLENAQIPVIETGVGNCHVYIDSPCNLRQAVEISINAKASNPAVCNAAETLIVHREVAGAFLPLFEETAKEHRISLRACPRAIGLLQSAQPASEEDWGTEYLDLILAVKVVDSLEEAIQHIAKYGTGHSEAIVTESYSNARKFAAGIDAAAVFVNASTRFTDGGEFGFGAEIGISTQKLHARGPMGLEEMTTWKYVVYGDGQVRR